MSTRSCSTLYREFRIIAVDESFVSNLVCSYARALRRDCALPPCSPAPLVTLQAGVPSVCVTNFSWDFVYAEYLTAAGTHPAHLQNIVWQVRLPPMLMAITIHLG